MAFAQKTVVTPSIPEFQTVAHDILQLEAESLGYVPDYVVLDSLLHEAQRAILVTPPYAQEDALTILQHIAALLHGQQFRIGDTMLLSQTCAVPQDATMPIHVGDCDTFSFLYLAIGDVLNLPLRIVSLPEHTFIRWEFEDGAYCNWETTANAVWTDDDYVNWYNNTHADTLTVDDLRPVARDEVLFLAHYNLGNTFMQQHRYDAAIAHYSASLDINPDYANAYYQRGQVWYVSGNYEQAIADFSQVLVRNSKDINARLNRGSAENAIGDYVGAIADFDLMLDEQPEHVDALFNRGTAWLYSGELAQALGDFNHVLALQPDDAEALASRSVVWSSSGQYEHAHNDLTRANTLNPWSADIANSLAWFLATCPDETYRNGEQAIHHALRALALQPSLRMLYLDTLAAAYAEAGQFQQAATTQESAIRLLEATVGADELSDYHQRLDLYQSAKPYREQLEHQQEE